MRRPDRDAVAAVALRRASASPRAADVHVDNRWWPPGRVLPAVDIAVEAAGLGEQRRGLEVDHPTADPHAIVEALGLGGRRGFARIARNGGAMKMRHMRIVKEVVDQKLGIG